MTLMARQRPARTRCVRLLHWVCDIHAVRPVAHRCARAKTQHRHARLVGRHDLRHLSRVLATHRESRYAVPGIAYIAGTVGLVAAGFHQSW